MIGRGSDVEKTLKVNLEAIKITQDELNRKARSKRTAAPLFAFTALTSPGFILIHLPKMRLEFAF